MSTVSNPILHDLIKSYLNRDSMNIFSFTSTLKEVKQSRIFKPESPHRLIDSKEEWWVDGHKYPADAVWRFSDGIQLGPSYYIIHEVKTGDYEIDVEMNKHYIHHNHCQLWIWGYPFYHKHNPKPKGSYIKQIDVNYLKQYITTNTIKLLSEWGI